MEISVFYFIFVGASGILTPYLPLYFQSIGFNGGQISSILSIGPLMMVFASPIWGLIADRTGKPALLLKIACLGATLSFAFMPGAKSFPAVIMVYSLYAMFSTTVSSLADTVAMTEARKLGTEYAKLRAWGSIGYIGTTYAFGEFLSRAGIYTDVVNGALILIIAYTALSQTLPRVPPPTGAAPPSIKDAFGLLADPALATFLFAAMIHWIALGSYYVCFSLLLKDLGIGPQYVGRGQSVGVVVEVCVMWKFRSIIRRMPLFWIIGFSFIISAFRWWLTATVTSAMGLCAIQSLHGLTFGAVFVASVIYLERAIPERLRATGRALFASVVLGAGGIIGSKVAGAIYDRAGAQGAFRAAAMLEVLAPVILMLSAWVGASRAIAETNREPSETRDSVQSGTA